MKISDTRIFSDCKEKILMADANVRHFEKIADAMMSQGLCKHQFNPIFGNKSKAEKNSFRTNNTLFRSNV